MQPGSETAAPAGLFAGPVRNSTDLMLRDLAAHYCWTVEDLLSALVDLLETDPGQSMPAHLWGLDFIGSETTGKPPLGFPLPAMPRSSLPA